MILSMELAGILERIQSRLVALSLTASKASKLAGKPDAIRNIQRAVKDGNRQGVTTPTLAALAPVLKTSATWLLTGKDDGGDEFLSQEIVASETVSVQEAIDGLAFAFEALEGAPEAEARFLARAVIRAIRTPPIPGESPMSDAEKRALVHTAVRLFRPK